VLALPAIASIDDLADGRQLLVLAGGGEIVVGVARPYSHPVAGCDWLSSRPRVRRVRRVRRAGPPRCPGGPAATARAEALLESLLGPRQLADWRTTRHFWVDTPRGPVLLGDLYALVHQPVDEPHLERVLCVVPDRHTELPVADIWVNLLLVLAVEPDAFFRVAIQRGLRVRRS